jgi:hypothetical protein
MRRRGRKPRRGAPVGSHANGDRRETGAGLDAGHRGGDQPHERRITAVVARQSAVAERAKTPRIIAERREIEGGERKANRTL